MSNFQLQKIERLIFYSIILFLPTQLGKHFWPSFSFVEGIRIDYLSPTLYLTDLLILFLLVTYVSRILIRYKGKTLNIKYQISNKLLEIGNWKLVVFVVFLLVGVLLSLSPIAGLYKLLKIAEMVFLAFYIVYNISFRKDLPMLIFLFSIGIIFESFLAIVQFIRQSSIGSIFWFFGERTFSGQTPGIANASNNGQLLLRPYGTFSHPNVLAGYLLIAMTVIISNFKFQISNFKKAILVSTILIGSIALLLTLSRIVIVLWIVIFTFYVFRQKKASFTYFLLFTIAIGGIIAITPLSSRFTSILDSDKETVTRRQELNLAAIEMIKTSPVLGIGLNNFLIELPKYQKTKAGPLWLQPAHNIFLLLAAEIGLIGLFCFVWFLLASFRELKKKKEFQISNFKFQILIIALFLGMFDHYFLTLQQGQLLFAMVFGLAWADENRRKQT